MTLTEVHSIPRRLVAKYPSGRFFWSLCFAYASFMALLLQKAILPLWPEMHAGHGLLMNDAIVFHNLAVEIAQRIQTVGWSEWSMYPPGASGNVGLLAAIYALLGPDPAWFIPFNAAAHATGAVLLYRIGPRLVPGEVGKLGGLITGLGFLIFPSALQWYGQNHKDAFAIVGILLTLDAWLGIHVRERLGLSASFLLIVQGVSGGLLLGLVRPYYVLVISAGLLSSMVLISVVDLLRRRFSTRVAVRALIMALLLGAVGYVYSQIGLAVGVYGERDVQGFMQGSSFARKDFHWQPSQHLPAVVDEALRRASELRVHFVAFGRSVGAGSEIDGDRLPDSAASAIAYMPRALFVGLFAPFPDSWGDRVTIPRLIGAMETAIWYLFVLGAVVTVRRMPSRSLLAGAAFCAALITVLAYIHPNVGTLYRQRFGFWHFFMLVGAIGWSRLFMDYLERRRGHSIDMTESGAATNNRSLPDAGERIAASGAVVILITLACYLGFFARDLLLIGQLGMGDELDAFFSAAMIPMFFVSCLAMPLGDALVIPFVAARANKPADRQRLLRSALGFAVLVLGVATLFVVVAAPYLVSAVLGEVGPEKQASAVAMLRWFCPIIALSAWTVIGNAALNSLGMQRVSASGQLIVPAITLVALVSAQAGYVVAAGIGGMVLGTAANALWVAWRLALSGLQLQPVWTGGAASVDFRRLYYPLVAAAFLPAVLVPINYAFAASVSVGMVAAWAFASKIVVLFSGLASVGATAVVLPHLAHVLSFDRTLGARQDANFLLALGIWLGGTLMLGGFLFAEPLVAAVLGGSLPAVQVAELSGIVKVGMLQLPMVISGALVNKLAIAVGRSSRVTYSAAIAFAGNLLVNILLVDRLGVMGVAVGSLVGVTLSTVVVLFGVYRHIGLAPREVFIALASWLSWVAICIALASGSTAALASAAIVLVGMGRVQWGLLRVLHPLLPNEIRSGVIDR